MSVMSTKELLLNNKVLEIKSVSVSREKLTSVFTIITLLCCLISVPEITVPIGKETAERARGIGTQINSEVIPLEAFVIPHVNYVGEEVKPEETVEIKETVGIKEAVEIKETVLTLQETAKPEEIILPSAVIKPQETLKYEGTLSLDYCVGSTIDMTGITILLDNETIPLENCVIEGLDTAAAGEKVITVTYEDKVIEIPYEVKDYTVTLHGNGAADYMHTTSLDNYSLNTAAITEPVLLGKEFTGWYRDKACTIPFVSANPGEVSLNLYAGWKDFDKYACDAYGNIIGYTGSFGSVTDGLLNLPADPGCTGITANALVGIEDIVTDVYVPANITNIEAGAFDSLPYLFFIYVSPDNPNYCSEGGVLYTKDMSTVISSPQGW